MIRPIIDLFKRFIREEEGAILLLTSLVLPLMIGFAALSVEIGLRLVQLEMLQSSADAAAYNGAMSIAYLKNTPRASYTPTVCNNEIDSISNKLSSINIFSDLTTNVTGCADGSSYVKVTMGITSQYKFLNAASGLLNNTFSSNNLTTQVTSVARITSSKNTYCMLALNQSAPSGFYVGGNTTITSTGCGVAVNSTNSSALQTNGSSAVIETSISTAGGYSYTGNPRDFTLSYAQPVQDPYRTNGSNAAMANYPTTEGSKFIAGTSGPGHYTSFTVGNNQPITLSSGTYYFDDANIGNNAIITGSGITIIFSNSANFKNIAGSTTFNLTAPSSGQYQGIAMASLSSSSGNGLNFRGTTGFSGSLYFPNATVTFSGNTNPTCIQLIADKILFNGSATLNNDLSTCPQFSNNQIVRTVVQLIR